VGFDDEHHSEVGFSLHQGRPAANGGSGIRPYHQYLGDDRRSAPPRTDSILHFKSSVALLTELVAQEVKGTGITVNAIAPSIIGTSANLGSVSGEDTSKWVTPEQIADIILSPCSRAAATINGTTIRAFGGL
jgi:hypothetical protein